MVDEILLLYGIQSADAKIETFGDGLINHTWKVCTADVEYILQQVNDAVFKNPAAIDQNTCRLKDFLTQNYPEYLFVSPLPALSGNTLIRRNEGYFRLFPFIKDSHTINVILKPEDAFEAARQFGKFSLLLNSFEADTLAVTLPDFHNLNLRYHQFLNALNTASPERTEKSKSCISFILQNDHIVSAYNRICSENSLSKRVIHHDTKISNVLFDKQDKGICVIDLDTVMSGYFISDVGDMMRTYLSAVSEEETDLSKITIRKEFFKAIYNGYMEQMEAVLTETEKGFFIYAGKFIILMQAIRFLTDYLQNDSYYGQDYEGHNLNRAKNQIELLKKYLEIENELKEIINL